MTRHPEVAAEGRPRRMNGQGWGRHPSRLAALAPQGDGVKLVIVLPAILAPL